MILASWLLFAMGLLGAADILFFHTLQHRLRSHAPARAELFTHFLRGPTYAALFLVVPNFALSGAALVALWALLAFDLAISIADFWLEPASRIALGGLPRGEYLLHVALAMLFGALVTSVALEAGFGFGEPTAFRFLDSGAAAPLRLALALMSPAVLATGFGDLAAFRRLGSART